MLVTVTPRVVHGTDRGGEDLFLDFAADGAPDQEPVTVEFGQEGDLTFEEDEDDTSLVVVTTENYEFEWRGTPEQLAQLAVGAGCQNEANWQWCGPVSGPPAKQFRHEHYVGGNAE